MAAKRLLSRHKTIMIRYEDKAIVSFTSKDHVRLIHWRDKIPRLFGVRELLQSISEVAIIYIIALATITLWYKLGLLSVGPWSQGCIPFIIHVFVKVALDIIIVY